MPPLKLIAGFMGRFAVLFVLFVAPWPGTARLESECLRGMATHIFGGTQGNREISFEALPDHPEQTRAVIVNRGLLNSDGSGPVRNMDLDLDRLVVRPLAVLLALILATPISWRRRGWAVLTGTAVLFVCVFAFLGLSLWVESAEVALADPSQMTKTLALDVRSASLAQAVIGLPVLIWLIVTIRRGDAAKFFPPAPQSVAEEI